MKRWKCLVVLGHQGAGRSKSKVVEVSAIDAAEAYSKAKKLPKVKHHGRAVLNVEEVE